MTDIDTLTVPCPECGLPFLPAGLPVHRKQKHGVPGRLSEYRQDDGLYHCPRDDCGAAFRSTSGIYGHLTAHERGVITRPRSPARLTCPECGDKFADARVLGLHRRNRHGVVGAKHKYQPKAKAEAALALATTRAPSEFEFDLDGDSVNAAVGRIATKLILEALREIERRIDAQAS